MASRPLHLLDVGDDGTIKLPDELIGRFSLDEPGAQVRIHERLDGVIELRPHVSVPTDQLWFWSDEWQMMEREADEDIAAGRVVTYDSAEEFLSFLETFTDS